MRIDPEQKWYPFYLLQPIYNIILAMLFEWGVAVHDLNFDAIRKGEKSQEQVRKELKGIAGKARSQILKDYIAWPLISGLVMTVVEAAYFAAKEETERRRERGGPVKNGLNKVRRSRAQSSGNVVKQSDRPPLVPRAVHPHADRRHRRQPDPQRLVLRDHLLRPLPRSDLHVHPGGDRRTRAAAPGTCAS